MSFKIISKKFVCVCQCDTRRLPGEQVHVVGHTGEALALPDNFMLLVLPLFHLCVYI